MIRGLIRGLELTPAFLAVLTLSLTAPAAGNGRARALPKPLFPESTARSIAWPDSIPDLSKGRMVCGDVTGDLQPDAVLLNGTTPVVVYAPAIHQALFEVPFVANDLALLRGTASGEPDTLVLVGPTGLSLLADYQAGQWSVAEKGGAEWLGATRVRVADTDRDGSEDLVGLSANDELLFLENLADALPQQGLLAIGETVFDFAPLDWLGDGSELAVAVLTPTGFSVRTQAGAVLFELEGGLDGGTLVVFRQSGLPFERLAIVYEALGTQLLVVADRDAMEASVPLGTDTVFALSVADVDLDQDEDLYLLHQVSHETVLFLNQASNPAAVTTFEPGLGELIDVAPGIAPAPQWASSPALFDFSSDGDPDLLVYVEATHELVYVENSRRRLEREQVQVHGGAYVYDEAAAQGLLHLDVSLPVAFPFSATHVEVVGWKQSGAAGGVLEAESAAAVHVFYPLASDETAWTAIVLDELDLYTPNIYHFDVRAVRIADDTLVAAGPSAVHAFTTPSSLVAELEAQFGPGTPLRVHVIVDGAEIELTDAQLAERLLAPKDVKTDLIPVITFPPNPFD